MPQHKPLWIIFPLPCEIILPPDVAVVWVIMDIVVVVTVGRVPKTADVNVRSVPYAVPALLVAYART